MNLLKKDYTYLLIEDFSIRVIDKDSNRLIKVPRGVIEDGFIKASNHLFYILKKFFSDNKKDNLKIFISTTKILPLNIELPLIDTEDMDSMINYEVENLLSINIDEYKISYAYKKKDNLIVDLRLAPIDLVNSYISLFKDLKINLEGIYSTVDIFTNCENLINFSISHSILKTDKVSIKRINNIDFIIEKYNLNYDEIISIANNKQSYLDEKDRKKVSEVLNNYAKQRIKSDLSKIKDGDIIIFGDFLLDSVVKIIDESLKKYKIGLDFEDIKTNENLNFINRKQVYNYKKIIFFLVFILINTLILKNIGYNSKVTNLEIKSLYKDDLKIRKNIKNLNLDSLKEERESLIEEIKNNKELKNNLKKNDRFERLFLSFEDLNSENILFTDYYYSNEIVTISGISKDKDEVNSVVENCPYTAELIKSNVENGIINFKIRVNLDIDKQMEDS